MPYPLGHGACYHHVNENRNKMEMCPDIAFGRRPPGTLCVACAHHGQPCGRPPREHGGRGKVSSLGRWPRKADPEGPQVKHSGHVPKTVFLSYAWEFSLCLVEYVDVGMGMGFEPLGRESWDKVSFRPASQLSLEGGRRGHAQPRPQIFFDRATALDATAIQEPRQQWRRFPDGETKGRRLP